MLFIFQEQAIISWFAIEFVKAFKIVKLSEQFVIIKYIRFDEISVICSDLVISFFNLKVWRSDLKSLSFLSLRLMLKSPVIIT